MFIMNNYLKIFVCILLSFTIVACESDYDKGYSAGYSKGKYDGFSEGEAKGYTKGYTHGTLNYIQEHGLPSLGLAIIILLFFSAIYFIYKYFKAPSKRIIDQVTDLAEEKRQRKIVKKELERKKLSAEELARIRANNLANKIFSKTIQSIADEHSKMQLEKKREEGEEIIFTIQMEAINKIISEYQTSFDQIVVESDISTKEKTDLFSEIKQILTEEITNE